MSSGEIKYNRTTRFILPALKLNEQALLNMGLVNVYLADNEYDVRWDLEQCLFLSIILIIQYLLSFTKVF